MKFLFRGLIKLFLSAWFSLSKCADRTPFGSRGLTVDIMAGRYQGMVFAVTRRDGWNSAVVTGITFFD
jgi:hypothetical protein